MYDLLEEFSLMYSLECEIFLGSSRRADGGRLAELFSKADAFTLSIMQHRTASQQ